MEKCVFMGYPSGYKGWLFYNPNTQKYIISERAEFDERVFPGLSKYKATSPVNFTSDSAPVPPATTPVDLGGDNDDDISTSVVPLPAPLPIPENPPVVDPLPAIPAPPIAPPPLPLPLPAPVVPPPGQAVRIDHGSD